MLTQQNFTSSDGTEFKLQDNWYKIKNQWPYNFKSFTEYVDQILMKKLQLKKEFPYFMNQIVTLNYMFQTINEALGKIPDWNKTLDIGTGPGTLPRLLKGSGKAKNTAGINLTDNKDEITDEKTKEFFQAFTYIMMNHNHNDHEHIKKAIQTLNFGYQIDYPITVPYSFFRENPEFSVDEYITDDVLEHDLNDNEYNLVTSVTNLHLFDPDEIFEKVSKTLKSGGVFFFITDFWYDLFGAGMHLPMDVPWLHARVTKDDLIRYYKECRPEISEYAEKAIFFKKTHQTPADYIETAEKYGLKLNMFKRSMLNGKEFFNSSNGFIGVFYNEILPNAQKINPKVTANDLFTYYLTMVFTKE